jgi:hypothetical protein
MGRLSQTEGSASHAWVLALPQRVGHDKAAVTLANTSPTADKPQQMQLQRNHLGALERNPSSASKVSPDDSRYLPSDFFKSAPELRMHTAVAQASRDSNSIAYPNSLAVTIAERLTTSHHNRSLTLKLSRRPRLAE